MRRGQITVFFSLLLPLLLALLGAALESACQQMTRSRIQRSLVLSEYSFLSEYQKDLWERYGLFYLDTAYGGREESEGTIKARLLTYLGQNLSWEEGEIFDVFTPAQVAVSNIEIGSLSRMTDDEGMGFYEQAVAFEQNLWGVDVLGSWLESKEHIQELEALEEDYAQAEAREKNNLEVLRQRRLEEEEVDTQDPTDGLRQVNEGLLALVIAESEQLSIKTISRQGIPSVRRLLEGSGSSGRYPGNLVNDQWFHTYLLERCTNAKDVLLQRAEEQVAEGQSTEGGGWLAYEMEYILAGKSSDMENLKAVVNRLVLLREGANYAYLLTDEAKKQDAYVVAAVIAGLTFMPEIVDALQQVILLGWAYGESVLDVRSLLQGNKVDLVKTDSSWKLPLSQLFLLRSHLDDYDSSSDVNGLDYEGYLRLLLTMMGRSEKCLRGLDIIEGNLRTTQLGRSFYVDQCADGFGVKVDFQYHSIFSSLTGRAAEEGYILTAERKISYEW